MSFHENQRNLSIKTHRLKNTAESRQFVLDQLLLERQIRHGELKHVAFRRRRPSRRFAGGNGRSMYVIFHGDTHRKDSERYQWVEMT